MQDQSQSGYITYRYECECCGKMTPWFEKMASVGNRPVKRRPSLFPSKFDYKNDEELNPLQRAERRQREELMLKGVFSVIKRKADKGDFSEFTEGASCPYCSARQSWLNAQPVSSVIISTILTLVVALFAGLFIGMVLTALGVRNYFLVIGLTLLLGLCIAVFKIILPHITESGKTKKAAQNGATNQPEINWDISWKS